MLTKLQDHYENEVNDPRCEGACVIRRNLTETEVPQRVRRPTRRLL